MVHTHFFQTSDESTRVLQSGVRLMRQLVELHSTVSTIMNTDDRLADEHDD
jgi:hypothetical protein